MINRINISLEDKDVELIEELKESTGISQTSALIRRALQLMNKKEVVIEEEKDEWSPDMPHINDAKRPELKENAKRNMESMIEMVDTPLGRMSTEAVKTLNMTSSEALSRLNGKEPNEEEIKHEKIMMMKRRYPEATMEQLEYYANLETDADGNLIYE
jgi:Arc/MetJ-type ribon-helix-helix transcriptional regulator